MLINNLFIFLLYFVVLLGFVWVINWIIQKKYRYALFCLITTIFTGVETFFFLLERDYLNQDEITYFMNQLTGNDLGAYIILILNLFVFFMSLYDIFFRKKKENFYGF